MVRNVSRALGFLGVNFFAWFFLLNRTWMMNPFLGGAGMVLTLLLLRFGFEEKGRKKPSDML